MIGKFFVCGKLGLFPFTSRLCSFWLIMNREIYPLIFLIYWKICINMYHNFYFMLDKLFITLLQTNECLYHWWKKSFSFTSFNSNYNRPKWNGAVRKNSVQGAAINCVNEFLWNYNFENFFKIFTFQRLKIPSKCASINGHALRKSFSLPLSAEFLNEKLLMKFSSLFIFSVLCSRM